MSSGDQTTKLALDVAVVEVRDGLLFYRYTVTEIDLVVVKTVVDAAAFLTPRALPTLVALRQVRRISRDARQFLAAAPVSLRVTSAAAFVVGSPLSRMIANFFVGLNKPRFPARLFADEERAQTWLRSEGTPGEVDQTVSE